MNPSSQFDQNAFRDNLDRLLDKALAKYAAVEPRLGLEERVLAHLRSEHIPVANRAWWRWASVAAAALVVVAAFLARTTGPPPSVIVNYPAIEKQPVPARAARIAKLAKERNPPHPRSAKRQSRQSSATTAAADPKLDVFPSPQPLTEEELALTQYVRNFPSDARLVAQTQQTSENEILRKMQVLANESGESN